MFHAMLTAWCHSRAFNCVSEEGHLGICRRSMLCISGTDCILVRSFLVWEKGGCFIELHGGESFRLMIKA